MIRKNFFRIAVTGMLSVAASLLCRTESQACTGISFTASDGSIAAAVQSRRLITGRTY